LEKIPREIAIIRNLEPPNRVAERLPNLWVSDYDETQFHTIKEKPASDIGVNEAYKKAIENLFGRQTLQRYVDSGEHQGRTPAEIVHDLEPDIPPEELPAHSQRLIRIKVDTLLDQVGTKLEDGTRWPRPTTGFMSFMVDVEMLKEEDPDTLTTAIVSAGHAEFILKTYDLYGIAHPDILVTDDVMQEGWPHLSPVERAKPSRLPMDVVRSAWAESNPNGSLHRFNVIYTGDDQLKDGQLAFNSGVDFVHVGETPDMQATAWATVAQRLQLGTVGSVHA
jgi:hypothetical protein